MELPNNVMNEGSGEDPWSPGTQVSMMGKGKASEWTGELQGSWFKSHHEPPSSFMYNLEYI